MTGPERPEAAAAEFPKESGSPERDVEENKDIAAFSYLWVMSLIVYVLKKDSPFVRFHSRQGIVLFLITIPIWLIPWAFLVRIFELFVFAGMVIGFLNAAQGQWKDVPFVGPLSRREQRWREIISVLVRFMKRVRSIVHRDARMKNTDQKPSPASTDSYPPSPLNP